MQMIWLSLWLAAMGGILLGYVIGQRFGYISGVKEGHRKAWDN